MKRVHMKDAITDIYIILLTLFIINYFFNLKKMILQTKLRKSSSIKFINLVIFQCVIYAIIYKCKYHYWTKRNKHKFLHDTFYTRYMVVLVIIFCSSLFVYQSNPLKVEKRFTFTHIFLFLNSWFQDFTSTHIILNLNSWYV